MQGIDQRSVVQWAEATVISQTELINQSTYCGAPAKPLLVQAINDLFTNYRCEICQLPGHIASYCPVNSMMYHANRGNPLYRDWLMVRGGIKADRKISKINENADIAAEIEAGQVANRVAKKIGRR